MISCAVVTLNCNKQLQDVETICSILDKIIDEGDPLEFVVFCLQEMMPTLDASMGWSEKYEEPFKNAVKDYKFVGKSVVGATCILAFSCDYTAIAAIHKDSVAFGMLWSSLKGAALLSVTLKYQRGKVTFVCPHLCANEGYKAQRDRDFNYMMKELGITDIPGQVIIAGDLNYRTADGKLESDELKQSIESGLIGKEFTESPITFQPTFRFHPGTNKYQDSKRTPSFCDRILYRPLEDITIRKYKSVMCEKIKSDHKPVALLISTPTKSWRSAAGWKTDTDQSPIFTATDTVGGQAILRSPPSIEEYIAPPLHPVPLRESQVSIRRLVGLVVDGAIGTVLYALTTRRGRIVTAALGLVLALALL